MPRHNGYRSNRSPSRGPSGHISRAQLISRRNRVRPRGNAIYGAQAILQERVAGYEAQPTQGLDLSVRRNAGIAGRFGFVQDNREPPRNRPPVFSGLPVVGSIFQGYSGTSAGPSTMSAPTVTVQAPRSTGYSPLDQFTPLQMWQYMNLPHTVTSHMEVMPPPDHPIFQGPNPFMTPPLARSMPQPVNEPLARNTPPPAIQSEARDVPVASSSSQNLGQVGRSYVLPRDHLLPSSMQQTNYQNPTNHRNPANPSNPSRINGIQLEMPPLQYWEPRPSTSQGILHAALNRDDNKRENRARSASSDQPAAKRLKKRSSEPYSLDTTNRGETNNEQRILERTNRGETIPHPRGISQREAEGSWPINSHKFLAQTGSPLAPLQINSDQSTMGIIPRDIIVDSNNTGTKRKEDTDEATDFETLIKTNVYDKYLSKKVPNVSENNKRILKQKGNVSGNAANGVKNGDNKQTKNTGTGLFYPKGNTSHIENNSNKAQPSTSTHVDSKDKSKNTSAINNTKKILINRGISTSSIDKNSNTSRGSTTAPNPNRNRSSSGSGNGSPLYRNVLKRAVEKKFSIDNSSTNILIKHRLKQNRQEQFKEPLPINNIPTKKRNVTVPSATPPLNKGTVLPKTTCPVFKIAKIPKVESKDDQHLDKKSTVSVPVVGSDLQTSSSSELVPIDTAIKELCGSQNQGIIQGNNEASLNVLALVNPSAVNKSISTQVSQAKGAGNLKRANCRNAKSDFRNDKSNSQDKPDFRDEKPVSRKGKSVSRKGKGASQDGKHDYDDGSKTKITIGTSSHSIGEISIHEVSAVSSDMNIVSHHENNVASVNIQYQPNNLDNELPGPSRSIQYQPNNLDNELPGPSGTQAVVRPVPLLDPLWLLDIVANDPQVEDYIAGVPYTNNGEDGGSSYEYYRLTSFQLCHLRVIPDDRLWKAYVLDQIMLDIAGVPEAMPERREELEAFSREIIIEALRRDYNVQDVETLRLCVINYLRKYPEFRLPLLETLVKDRENRK